MKVKFSLRAMILPAIALLSVPGTAAAQGDGYLFGQPRVSFTVIGGWAVPTASSDIYDFTSDLLTVDSGDFASSSLGVQLGISLAPRLDLVFEGAVAKSTTRSEFRDFVEETDQGDLPIQQFTTLSRVPLTVSVRYFLLDRGRAIGQFAWVPAKWSPYLGAGAGRISYQFKQEGDFVDTETLDIFTDLLESKDSGLITHAFAGVDISLAPHFNLMLEGRYSMASSPMRWDFVGFDDIDLSGFQATVGLGLRF